MRTFIAKSRTLITTAVFAALALGTVAAHSQSAPAPIPNPNDEIKKIIPKPIRDAGKPLPPAPAPSK